MSEKMPSTWIKKSLADLGQYVNGFAFKPDDWKSQGLPIIRIAQITGSSSDWDFYQGTIADTFKINSGDLIFSWSGTLKVVEWRGGPAWLNQHLFKVIPTHWVYPRFLYHVLSASIEEMDKRAHGSTMKHIKRGELKEYFVDLPSSFEEQKTIANILDALDTQIRQTEAIIAKLQQVKQGLLHDLLTRGLDASGKLRLPHEKEPELYKESPLGWIPKKWLLGRLDDWLQVNPKNGYSPPEAEEKTGLFMLGLGCLSPDGFEARQLKNAPRNDTRVWGAELKEGDLLISRANTRETVGFVGRYQDVGQPCFYPDLMMRLTFNEGCITEFMEYILRSPATRKQIQAAASGTSESMVKINSSIVKSLLIAIAPHGEQNKIIKILSTHQQQIKNENKLLKKLKKQKAGLMDDLLTGRVRVTNQIEQQRAS